MSHRLVGNGFVLYLKNSILTIVMSYSAGMTQLTIRILKARALESHGFRALPLVIPASRMINHHSDKCPSAIPRRRPGVAHALRLGPIMETRKVRNAREI